MIKKFVYSVTSALFFCAIFVTGCTETAVLLESPKGKDFSVLYEMEENVKTKDGVHSVNSFTLTNNGRAFLLNNWAIYFNAARTMVPNSVKGDVSITNINGDFYKIEPAANFDTLQPNADLVFSFETNDWMTKEGDLPVGFYIVFKDTAGVEKTPEMLGEVTYAPLTKPSQINRGPEDKLIIPTPESRFAANSLITDLPADQYCPIIPTPTSYAKGTSDFEITAATKIFYDKGLENEVKQLKVAVKELIGAELASQEGEGNGIRLAYNLKASPVNGAYVLKVSKEGVFIACANNTGAFYGIQSLRALVDVQSYVKAGKSAKVQGANVTDVPSMAYRGMHLDVVRNFQKKEDVINLLNLMSFYKLNKFHFHMVDDEGWRLAIDGLPELTEVGSKRGHTKDESDMLMPAYGSGPFADPATSNGNGFYTKADFVEILKYAKERHIEVIPELDFPGHARAAVVSMKARYNKYIKTDAAKAKEYMLHDVNDKSEYLSVQFYKDNVVNVGMESTYKFLGKVVDEVVKMYTEAGLTLNMVHTGGDEIPKGVWEKSPVCVDFMAKSDKYKTAHDLFYYFVDRFSTILAERKIATGGWEEIGLRKQLDENDEEVIAPNKDFMGKGFVPYVWNTVWGWGCEDRGYQLANAGYKVVLSNVNNLYFDLSYDKDPYEPGYYWGGYVSERTAWEFVPYNIFLTAKLDRMGGPIAADFAKDKEKLNAKSKSNIIGIQGQLWAETVKGHEAMEYMAFPKIISLAERAWNAEPKWASIAKPEDRQKAIDAEYNKFSNTLAKRDLVRLEYISNSKKLNYRLPAPGAKVVNDTLYMNTEYPGFVMKYSVDGKTWLEYKTPTPVKSGTTVSLKLVAVSGRESRVTTVK
jgi:hexosaminidase